MKKHPYRRLSIHRSKLRRKAEPRHDYVQPFGKPNIFRRFGRGILRFCTLIGVVVMLLALVGLFAGESRVKLPNKMVLTAHMAGLAERPPAPAWMPAALLPPEPTLHELTETLYAAAKDPRVTALAIKVDDGDYPMAAVQEFHMAVEEFKKSGKKTYAYSESYGDLSPGMNKYLAIAGFDEIWVQPMGGVAVTGYAAQVPYAKEALAKLGVVPEMEQRKEYKTAPESLLRQDMSAQQRETLETFLSDYINYFTQYVGQHRGITKEQMDALIDKAPLTAQQALEAKLIDHIGFADEIDAKMAPDPETAAKTKEAKTKTGGDDAPGFVDIFTYAPPATEKSSLLAQLQAKMRDHDTPEAGTANIAVVYIEGMILPTSDGLAKGIAAADAVAPAIYQAADDKSIGAIVLRVNSPGGSPSASETIRRAVVYAKTKKKPVIVSMGSEAASGGYWVSVDADLIYALPGTLTGSIGVFGGKFDLSGLWNKLGVTWETVGYGEHAAMWSTNAPYSESGRKNLAAQMDAVYEGFVARVSEGRKLDKDAVERIAGGRVWTGGAAIDNGLADRIGGLAQALDEAAISIGLEDRTQATIITLPEQPGPFEELSALLTGVKASAGTLSTLSAFAVSPDAALLRSPVSLSQ